MSKPLSEATVIKRLRYELKQVNREATDAKMQAFRYRERATKAEQEVAEWKARFDKLLNRQTQPVAPNGRPETET